MCFAAGPRMLSSEDFASVERLRTLTPGIRSYLAANNGVPPWNPADLAAYLSTAAERQALEKETEELARFPRDKQLDTIKAWTRLRLL
jgi:hypothetical protein